MSYEGYLFDLDGTVYANGEVFPGVSRLFQSLRRKNIPFRFLTNTSTRSRGMIAETLVSMGVFVEESEIVNSSLVAAQYLREARFKSGHFLLQDGAMDDFKDFKRVKRKPDFLVVGDLGEDWNHAKINEGFRSLMDGAHFVALHHGRYCEGPDGLRVDLGAYVAALEYASGVKAKVIGKPENSFFEIALKDLGSRPSKTLVVGDDIYGDIDGAQKAGLRACLVKTGKYRPDLVKKSGVTPDLTLRCLGDLEI